MSSDTEELLPRGASRSWAGRFPASTFIAINLGLTALVGVPAWLFDWEPDLARALFLPTFFSPLLAALYVAHASQGEGGAERLVAGFFRWRVGLRWYLAALLCFPLLACGALALRSALFDIAPHGGQEQHWTQDFFLALFLFFFPGITEELGWRGFLQASLQRRFGAFLGSVGVGLTWGLWHGRSLITEPDAYRGEPYLWFMLLVVGSSVILGWIWNHTRGSVLLAMIGHFGANVVFSFFPMGSDPLGDRSSGRSTPCWYGWPPFCCSRSSVRACAAGAKRTIRSRARTKASEACSSG